jgi:hypothetical protein
MDLTIREIGLGSVCEWLRLAQDRGGGGLLWIRWWTCGFWRYGVMTSTLRQVPYLLDHLCCSACKGFKRWCVTFSILFFWTWYVVRHSRTKTLYFGSWSYSRLLVQILFRWFGPSRHFYLKTIVALAPDT